MSAGIGEATALRLAPGVLLRHDAARGQWHLLGPERILVLDEIAVEIVRACVGDGAGIGPGVGPGIGKGIDDLAARFEAPRDEIAGDVLAMLDDLLARGFIVP